MVLNNTVDWDKTGLVMMWVRQYVGHQESIRPYPLKHSRSLWTNAWLDTTPNRH